MLRFTKAASYFMGSILEGRGLCTLSPAEVKRSRLSVVNGAACKASLSCFSLSYQKRKTVLVWVQWSLRIASLGKMSRLCHPSSSKQRLLFLATFKGSSSWSSRVMRLSKWFSNVTFKGCVPWNETQPKSLRGSVGFSNQISLHT